MFCPQVWYFTGTRQIAELHALDRLPGELLDAAVAYYRRWEQGFKYYNMPMGGDGYKPLFTSAMWSEANAIAEVAKSLGRNELAAEFAPASSPVVNGLYEAAVILFGLPLVVSLGAGSRLPTAARGSSLCRVLGELSYPLYLTHFPFVYMQKAWVANHPSALLSQQIAVSFGAFVVALALAFAVMWLYDTPVRAWLKHKL